MYILRKRFYYYRRHTCKRNGRIDGKKGIPPIDQVEHSQFERELISAAEENLSYIGISKEKRDRKLKTKYCKAKFQKKNYDEQIPHMKKALEKSQQEFEASKKGLDNLEYASIRGVFYWMLFIFFVIAEFPLNSRAFFIFGEDKIMTAIMAATICVGIPILAHFSGIYLKKYLKGISLKERVATVTFVTTILLCLGGVWAGIAYIRGKYFEARGLPETERILQEVIKMVNINIAIAIFLVINAFIFLIIAWAAYLAYPAEPKEYRNIKRRFKEARKERRAAQKSLSKAEKESLKASKKLEKIRALRQQNILRECDATKNGYLNLIWVYRKENLRTKDSLQIPESFKVEPSFRMPSDLSLDWECEFQRNE